MIFVDEWEKCSIYIPILGYIIIFLVFTCVHLLYHGILDWILRLYGEIGPRKGK